MGSAFMLPDKVKYSEMVKKASPPSKKFKDFFMAYLVGGLICVLGQLLFEMYMMLGTGEKNGRTLVSCSLIFLAAILTGLKLFEKIAKYAGAGTLVPITGFSNAITSPAIEFRAEGFILGVGAKIFTIAGPVIVYGTVASVMYGLIYWITTLF